jgi:hypothetical protein
MMKMGMRSVALACDDAVFEPSPDGGLQARNLARLDPNPARLTERLRHWAPFAPRRRDSARVRLRPWPNDYGRTAFEEREMRDGPMEALAQMARARTDSYLSLVIGKGQT